MNKKLCLAICVFILIANFSKAAKVDTVSVYSNAMHKYIKCSVVLPDDYSGSKTFPVVYLLHGYSGSYKGDWATEPNVKKCVDEYNIIAVCPDGGYSSWYFDSPIDSTYRYETFVAKEVPAYIDSHFSTIKDRKHRAIAGLSMGGHGAMFIAIKHKDFFGACGSMSGGVDFTPFPNSWDIAKRLGKYEDNKELWKENTVNYLVNTLKNGELAITFECGVNDEYFIKVNRALHQKLLDLKIDHDYAERPGRHQWSYWHKAIEYEMLFFHNYFSEK